MPACRRFRELIDWCLFSNVKQFQILIGLLVDKFSELVKKLTSMLFQYFGGLTKVLLCTWLRSIQICLPLSTTVLVWVENIHSFFFG